MEVSYKQVTSQHNPYYLCVYKNWTGNKIVWYKLPKDIYKHKKYPKCIECERKFVPTRSKKICLRCLIYGN